MHRTILQINNHLCLQKNSEFQIGDGQVAWRGHINKLCPKSYQK